VALQKLGVLVQGVTSRLSELFLALKCAQTSPQDLRGDAIDADAVATPRVNTAQLIWLRPRPRITGDSCIASCSCRVGEATVARWTLCKDAWDVCNGAIPLPPSTKLLLSGSDLSFNGVRFLDVIICLLISHSLQ
jgi:hypothetical protein